jgi:hypothetical protein
MHRMKEKVIRGILVQKSLESDLQFKRYCHTPKF